MLNFLGVLRILCRFHLAEYAQFGARSLAPGAKAGIRKSLIKIGVPDGI
jgi:hypothetical protein